MNSIVENYLNGNIKDAKAGLSNASFSLGEILDYFVNHSGYCPSNDEIVRFVKCLE